MRLAAVIVAFAAEAEVAVVEAGAAAELVVAPAEVVAAAVAVEAPAAAYHTRTGERIVERSAEILGRSTENRIVVAVAAEIVEGDPAATAMTTSANLKGGSWG